MGWIYQHAIDVLIFLGDDSPESSGAAEYINRMLKFASQTKSITKTEKKQLLAVSALLSRPWFSRRWVIQEVALARKATVMVPSYTSHVVCIWKMPWVDFADAVPLFSRRADLAKHLTPDEAYGLGEIDALGAASLVNLTNNLHRKDSEDRILDSLLDLESLLTKIPMFDVTQIQDAVYAVLSLAKDTQSKFPDHESPPIPINYHISPSRLFAYVVRFIIKQTNSLDILCRPWAPSGIDLPSWIATVATCPYARRPDGSYHRQYADTLVRSPGARGKFYNASGGSGPTVWQTCSVYPNNHEHTKGLYLEINAHDHVEDEAIEKLVVAGVYLDEILCIGYHGWMGIEEECPAEFWRTVVGDRGPDSENAPSWYRRACQHVYRRIGHVDLDTTKMITISLSDDADFLRRMQSVTWGRRFFKTRRGKPGLGPPDCKCSSNFEAQSWGPKL
ncbi:hypothetical protein AOQ84DRAFT_363707 [Glonium stellatum]|uniref:Heterokaryon incompatibility domain-containing protein n=1 Tax=Glonium stellatum TaxID=574774 RepID=A0A8E2F2G2_9PEZI|nr:hypothetical protein AOQ84DRAFT_363707 [Glonium stellatum]